MFFLCLICSDFYINAFKKWFYLVTHFHYRKLIFSVFFLCLICSDFYINAKLYLIGIGLICQPMLYIFNRHVFINTFLIYPINYSALIIMLNSVTILTKEVEEKKHSRKIHKKIAENKY